jgi:hypothetical protein
VRLVVAGMSADVIPAFHVANLALAAAARHMSVRIEDRSGLPVNAGCFLGLDPRCWVAGADGCASSVAAFAHVTFSLASDALAPAPRAGAADGVEIVHVPPWDTGAEHARELALGVSLDRPTVLLYLAERDAEPRPWRQHDGRSGLVRRVAYVTRAGRAGAGDGCAGTFTRWTRALTDPLPAVLRDPGSRLARQYGDAVSALLSDADAAAQAGAGVRIHPGHAAAALEPR